MAIAARSGQVYRIPADGRSIGFENRDVTRDGRQFSALRRRFHALQRPVPERDHANIVAGAQGGNSSLVDGSRSRVWLHSIQVEFGAH